ncbi:MAG: Abi family protein [Bacteroidales bacterium]|nr:Abi family protein [Bacteroidales bacterium]
MPNRIPFHKIYTNAQDLVLLLQSRGLTVNDPAKAERYLEYIGYYRLSAYMYPLFQMPKELHQYKQDTSFDQVMTLYRFDKKLRLLIFNEIEKIEVAVRRDKLLNLLADYPSIDQAAMGFPLGWQQEPLWQ